MPIPQTVIDKLTAYYTTVEAGVVIAADLAADQETNRDLLDTIAAKEAAKAENVAKVAADLAAVFAAIRGDSPADGSAPRMMAATPGAVGLGLLDLLPFLQPLLQEAVQLAAERLREWFRKRRQGT